MLQALNFTNIWRDLVGMSTWGRFFFPCSLALIIIACSGNNVPWWEWLASISGVLCVLMVADRRMTNYFWGLINCTLYGMIAYNNGIFGDAALNWGVYVPFQFIGMYLWSRNGITAEDGTVESRGLTASGLVLTVMIVGFSIFGLSVLLTSAKGAQPLLDASTTVLALAATALMAMKYKEQWICWILVNIVSIVMWTKTYLAGDGEGVAALAMWIAFFANSCYGYYNWNKSQVKNKVSKKQSV